MSTIKTQGSFRAAETLAAGAALFVAVIVAGSVANAGSTRTDLERRQQTMQSSTDAANQRTIRERETADRQRQLLEYQVRKNNRTQLKMQCKLAGGGNGC
jgi:hypothetical protein